MRSGLFFPLFDDLADPMLVARLSAEAEEAGWDGVFVWDHIRWREPVVDVADPWITLAAIASTTQAIRIGPMVTPLARRRPAKVARETATLDRLSEGRLIMGVGLGSDRFGHEYTGPRPRIDRLEQEIRWSTQKAESLPSSAVWRFATGDRPARISRLLVVRATRATRELAMRYPDLLTVAYPASAHLAFRALHGEVPWPGDALLWADVDAGMATIRSRPPRGVRVGR
jgi:alkanesulfonate monooxygenase SsuD/methylene tetrahydromethanopterin reductase-like flavin-dependent oxidoreductase (luciferase family)